MVKTLSRVKKADEKILDAAMELFSKYGYDGASTRTIAKKAKVNEVTLFRKYGSKEGLFFAVTAREADIKEKLNTIDFEPSSDLVEDLTNIGWYMTQNMVARAKFIKLLLQEKDRYPKIWGKISKAPFGVLSWLSSYFRKAVEKGTVRDIDTDLVAVAFFSFFFRTLVANAFLGEDVFIKMDRLTIRKFVELFVNGIIE
jgi:AcrR family transcriptional regulator